MARKESCPKSLDSYYHLELLVIIRWANYQYRYKAAFYIPRSPHNLVVPPVRQLESDAGEMSYWNDLECHYFLFSAEKDMDRLA